jgi:hypothetical protein
MALEFKLEAHGNCAVDNFTLNPMIVNTDVPPLKCYSMQLLGFIARDCQVLKIKE